MISSELSDKYTTDAIADHIQETWKMHKDEQHQISGDAYYDKINHGVLHDEQIEITAEDLPDDLRIQLDKLSDMEVHMIITKVIKNIFAMMHGNTLMRKAEAEKRFHWRFLK